MLNLKRKWFTDKSTVGELFLDNSGVRECFTLEDCVREKKIDGKTAIPKGEYEIVISYSNKFKKLLPLLLAVPNYNGVRIHSGNTDLDTEGCILVGLTKDKDILYESRRAFASLFYTIQKAMNSGKVYISITEEKESSG